MEILDKMMEDRKYLFLFLDPLSFRSEIETAQRLMVISRFRCEGSQQSHTKFHRRSELTDVQFVNFMKTIEYARELRARKRAGKRMLLKLARIRNRFGGSGQYKPLFCRVNRFFRYLFNALSSLLVSRR